MIDCALLFCIFTSLNFILFQVTIVITEMQKNGADAEKLIPLPLEPEEAIYKIIAFKRVMVIEKGNCLAFPDSLIEVRSMHF